LLLLDQMRDDLGVGVRGEGVSSLLQPGSKRWEVLYDPVVDDRYPPPAVDVRMGVHIVRHPVGRPPRVADPDATGRSVVSLERPLELPELADALDDPQLSVEQRHPGRVVAPVLEAAQAGQDDGERLLRPDIPDDAAHGRSSLTARGP